MNPTRMTAAGEQSPIPPALVRWGGIAWRLGAIGFVAFHVFQAAKTVGVVLIAGALALLLASIMWTPVRRMTDRGWPSIAAVLFVLSLAGALLVGIVLLTIPPIVSNVADLSTDVDSAVESVREWLTMGPLGLEPGQVEQFQSAVMDRMSQGSSLMGGATTAFEAITGTLLAVIFTFFILKDGRSIAGMLRRRVPEHRAEDVAVGLQTIRATLARYMVGMAIVGLFDAAVIGIGLVILGVPLALPLSILVFFGAFFPLIGAFVSGLLAVAVAFVNGGLTDALIVLGITVAVQQFEGDVIMPLVFGRALQLHPVAILVGVTGGGLAFGIMGAFVAVPLIATVVALREELGEDPDRSLLTIVRGP